MSDYLSDEEQVEVLKRWWRENGTWLIVGIVIAIGGVIGWRVYHSHVAEQVAESSDLYQEYLEELDNPEAREAVVAEMQNRFTGSAYHAFVLLSEARLAVQAGDLAKGESLLAEVAGLSVDSAVRDVARVRRARLLRQLDRSDEALALLAEVRGDGFRSEVAELTGDLHLEAGDRARAHEAYRAALDAVGDPASRPVLRMKVDDTAPPESGA